MLFGLLQLAQERGEKKLLQLDSAVLPLKCLIHTMHASCAAVGLIASRAKRKGSPCQQDDDSQNDQLEIQSGPTLPEVRHNTGRLAYRDDCFNCSNQ